MRPLKVTKGQAKGGFPRARGDAPARIGGTELLPRVPPRTRGCARRLDEPPGLAPGSPAHAGMRPSGRAPSEGWRRFPRARGDAPVSASDEARVCRVPPRTRGCALLGDVAAEGDRGSPAHAGMRPPPRRSSRPRAWFPRARGDAPSSSIFGATLTPVPPRTRGCARGHHARRRCDRGSPAHAGMRPGSLTSTRSGRRFPRARGDAPMGGRIVRRIEPVPPRTRGCALVRAEGGGGVHGSPAHAGMRLCDGRGRRAARGFPRARGDAPLPALPTEPPFTVPPRTRGCARRGPLPGLPREGSPAHAGMRPVDTGKALRTVRFPRARGDAPGAFPPLLPPSWVPPRTRGCAPDLGREDAAALGSPAHAGMRPSGSGARTASLGFPRARGDAPSSETTSGSRFSVPPRTRGCALRRALHLARAGGSPAHAGMRPCKSGLHVAGRGFPRARGDAPPSYFTDGVSYWVPPRTRGCAPS